MGKLVDGDDGLPVEEVGMWAKEKHTYLCRYIEISSATRKKYLGPEKGGAAYVDLFCGPGRSFIPESREWIDGGAVAAWKRSQAVGSPFTRIIVGDADPIRLSASVTRLRSLGAPVIALAGTANDVALKAIQKSPVYGLNFAFLDPYNLEALDFKIIEMLSRIKRMDILVHVSAMDLQRNLGTNIFGEQSAFDAFAPGWRDAVNLAQSQPSIRRDVFDYWRAIVAKLGVWPSTEIKLITGSKNQPLYWLLLAARHELAHKFWATASNLNRQRSLF
ncbi:three-Cys-motif partner protein TcmP [Mesorhizobium retamae]|uniref:Three-Cys-motif partner protein TcmP n=1 Tax=Mesorhizobium retamae TaxID=2912854 RepID=A0ABS9QRK8_9HYPH|nr:three-Cys-motif partner protein TcmP [Mesorhizobium sp. IRAMC:0171]MCG7509204.1 three-Cys-motif partner protein TcmP [Mesorhizobium sp. IRAMC:0171]